MPKSIFLNIHQYYLSNLEMPARQAGHDHHDDDHRQADSDNLNDAASSCISSLSNILMISRYPCVDSLGSLIMTMMPVIHDLDSDHDEPRRPGRRISKIRGCQ
jgi:hypothetical protein